MVKRHEHGYQPQTDHPAERVEEPPDMPAHDRDWGEHD